MPRLPPALRACVLALLVVAAPSLRAQGGWPAETGDALTDLAGVVSPEHADSIRAYLADLRAARGVDVRVVTIGSVRDYPVGQSTIEGFATGLFNAWGIDDAGTNDGVLLLVAVGDRQVRIELGDGAAPDMDRRTRVLVDEYVLPHFRNGQVSRGVLTGVKGIVGSYGGGPMPQPVASSPAESSSPAGLPTPDYATGAGASPTAGSGPGGGVTPAGWGVLGGTGGLAALGVWLARRRRYAARSCPECRTGMRRLDDVSEDVYLNDGQKAEELLKSVDYDVWKCDGCGHHALLPYPRLFSSAAKCRSCGYKAAKVTRTTIQHATYTSSGRQRVAQDCTHCGHHHETEVTLPRLTRSTSSSSGSRSSFSGGGGGSRGGSSSGRGSSGSW
jgi:uncharacterized protein